VSISTTGVLAHARKRAAGPPRTAVRRRPDLRRWISPVVLLAAWQLASATGVLPSDKLSAPWTVVQAGIEAARSGELGTAFAVSLGRVGAGFALGAVAGVLLGIVSGLSRWGEALVDPPVQMLRTLPFLALVPLFILWFGIGETPKIALVALGSAFPIYLTLFAGIRGVDAKLVEAASVFGLSQRELVRQVILPGALPSALVGLRYSLGSAWLSLVIGEQINASSGIGYLVMTARDFLRTDIIFVGLIVYALLGLGADQLVRAIERSVLRWRPSFVKA